MYVPKLQMPPARLPSRIPNTKVAELWDQIDAGFGFSNVSPGISLESMISDDNLFVSVPHQSFGLKPLKTSSTYTKAGKAASAQRPAAAALRYLSPESASPLPQLAPFQHFNEPSTPNIYQEFKDLVAMDTQSVSSSSSSADDIDYNDFTYSSPPNVKQVGTRPLSWGSSASSTSLSLKQSQDLIRNADHLLKAGNWKEALKCLDTAIDQAPEGSLLAEVYHRRGRIMHHYMGKPDAAMDDYSMCLHIDRTLMICFWDRAELIQYAMPDGDLYLALADYNYAIDGGISDPDIYYSRGELRKRMSNFEGAYKDFQKACTMNPHHNLALEHLRQVREKLAERQVECVRDAVAKVVAQHGPPKFKSSRLLGAHPEFVGSKVPTLDLIVHVLKCNPLTSLTIIGTSPKIKTVSAMRKKAMACLDYVLAIGLPRGRVTVESGLGTIATVSFAIKTSKAAHGR